MVLVLVIVLIVVRLNAGVALDVADVVAVLELVQVVAITLVKQQKLQIQSLNLGVI